MDSSLYFLTSLLMTPTALATSVPTNPCSDVYQPDVLSVFPSEPQPLPTNTQLVLVADLSKSNRYSSERPSCSMEWDVTVEGTDDWSGTVTSALNFTEVPLDFELLPNSEYAVTTGPPGSPNADQIETRTYTTAGGAVGAENGVVPSLQDLLITVVRDDGTWFARADLEGLSTGSDQQLAIVSHHGEPWSAFLAPTPTRGSTTFLQLEERPEGLFCVEVTARAATGSLGPPIERCALPDIQRNGCAGLNTLPAQAPNPLLLVFLTLPALTRRRSAHTQPPKP